jgi:hypothetical protein
MLEHLKVVLEDGFANGCEGATVHGMEMNHLSCQVARVYGMEMNHISCSMTFISYIVISLRRWSWGYCYYQVH